ncbi:probable flavin-containing monoamine oxidase A [Physella acuta]|uniref:probable flavin-containing monoamine oxidase A n=1 Tax=Physella acuta TaxID=109671 RepID=UPI0027DD5664|nr:probable flavin-containing monoamine oxidase A [Physella acuta]XP_059142721.1 probable flavin-containing monoamine oxidase A [Physella acuta]XP_059142722.1 probable flavin-containing monoamine oxidase A [Physella acuta]
MNNNYDVIVVGAGISGLTAAYNIKKKDPNAKVVVLEGKDRVGGRTQTVPLKSSTGTDLWDIGGQWVGRCQPHILNLLKELGIDTYPQYIKGTKHQQLGETKIRSYTSNIPKLSICALLDLQWLMFKLDRYANQLSVEDPLSHPCAEEWDALSLAAYLERTLYTQGARDANNAATRSILGCETSQVSFLYYLLYVKMAGGITNLVEATEYRAQEWKIVGGAQQISEKLAGHIGSEGLRKGDPVVDIKQTDTAVAVTTASGWKGTASFVILALPPKGIEHIQFNPKLSADRVDFMKHMPMGTMVKVIITYEKAFWRAKGFSGEIVSDGGEATLPGCIYNPICITYDATTHNGSPALVGFMAGEPAVEWAKQPEELRKKSVLTQLSAFLGEEVLKPLAYIEKDWNLEPYSWGAPVSYVAPGGMLNFTKAIRRPEGRIHFAGTETATAWSGYMSGAVQAGERTAAEVLSRLRPAELSKGDQQEGTLCSGGSCCGEGGVRAMKLRRARRGKTTLSVVLSYGLGLGLVTAAVLVVERCVRNGEIGWSYTK